MTVVTAVLGSSVVAGLLTAFLTGLRGLATARRDQYAAAIESLVAWAEYPYRVRRRVDDAPETLSRLAGLGSDLQESVSRHRAWVGAESPAVGEELGRAIEALRSRIGPAIAEAWRSGPVTSAAEMIVAPFGPGDLSPGLDRLHSAIKWRFGLRRVVPNWFVRWRLTSAGQLTLPPSPGPAPSTAPSGGPV
ncbi:hypothetical protein [Nakamurella endophytica]|uniref:hypothetical protein n=1 Tax=Nakamurella endophytica TaxID=1748367 RepID=UPI001667CEBC|nr:hypothetical protein [Nakamurella endophytica]